MVLSLVTSPTPLAAALVLSAALGTACSRPPAELRVVTATPAPTVRPDDSPTPLPAPTLTPSPQPTAAPTLNPEHIWVAPDSDTHVVVDVALDGTAAAISLPLAEDATASSVTASPDGSAIAYLVWDADGDQQGVAVWRPDESESTLIAEPRIGFRIIALRLAADGSRLAYVQVQDGQRWGDAAWQLNVVGTQTAGESSDAGPLLTAATGESLPELTPPLPFAWPQDGPILLVPAVPPNDGGGDGIYASDPAGGGTRALLQPEGRLIGLPQLSPDGTQLALLAGNPEGGGADAVQIHDLRLDETTEMQAPPGEAIYGLRWQPDGDHLLLDLVAPSPDDTGQLEQFWALVEAGQPPPWHGSTRAPGPGRAGLFDYEVTEEGVIYTLLPENGESMLFLTPDLANESNIQQVELGSLFDSPGAATIIRVP